MKQPYSNKKRPHSTHGDRAFGTTRGFSRAAGLMQQRIRGATQTRGFAQSRVLTHWVEIVGDATAKIAQPVDISYARGGLGATLSLLTSGAQAPMLEMQKEQIREKVNACYGYNAIARIRITQTATTGFAEGQMTFDHGHKRPQGADPQAQAAACELTKPVTDDSLRAALAALGANVITKHAKKS